MTFWQNILGFNADSPLLFTQFYFWAFFALVYALFALIMERIPNSWGNKKLHLRNIYLFFVSWFFYYKTSGLFLLILAFITLSDWLIAGQIYKSNSSKDGLTAKRSYSVSGRLWLCLSVAIDLGLLAYFKYAYFFTNMINDLFGTGFRVFDMFAYIGNGFSEAGRFSVDTIILPVGISFYIFQVISYTADVFRGRILPVKNILDFGFYVSFFPQLVAGPIVRAEEFIPQLYKPFRLSRRAFGIAVFWIINGLAKKIIMSDYLAVNLIDRVFDNPLLFSGFENLFALFAYSLQVYADFSGYTDIAIGIAMLMGFYLPMNFNSPYKSQSPQEFWRRWHMSLGRWLKTYLYIPLGGNRSIGFGTYFWWSLIAFVSAALMGWWWILIPFATFIIGVAIWNKILQRSDLTAKRPYSIAVEKRKLLYSNLNSFITQVLGGLWHGASWNFIIWGGINGIGMIVEKIWREMNWHIRFATMTLLTIALCLADHFTNLPAWRLFAVWALIIWIGTVIRYIYWLCKSYSPKDGLTAKRSNSEAVRQSKAVIAIGKAWAILQTFAFITFTRLFFRSSSNLDPATANEVAWATAKNMVNQIGGAWSNAIIPDFIWEYRWVVAMFCAGMLIHWLPTNWKRRYRLAFSAMPLWIIVGVVCLAIIVIYQFVSAEMQPFIYFQF
jgi:D-alanyl-lipoteichoic acid acyltransferase DltB (MBOAT superfamily)